MEKYLIVNADDFGQAASINRGVIEAHEKGIVTSASLMVRFPAAAAAAEYGRAHPELSLGLHFDLGEWAYKDGTWSEKYHVADDRDSTAVAAEVGRQLALFRSLMDREPTHLDSHQHVHRSEPTRGALRAVAAHLGVPLRDNSPIRYRGDFYGQSPKGEPVPEAIGLRALLAFLDALQPGVTELGCHPGDTGGDLDSMYTAERPVELASLCHPRVRQAIETRGIRLCSFADPAVITLQS